MTMPSEIGRGLWAVGSPLLFFKWLSPF